LPVGYEPLLAHLPAWVLVLFRLTGIFLAGPVFGSTLLPVRVKALMAFGLSLCVYPMLIGGTLPIDLTAEGVAINPSLPAAPLAGTLAAASISAVIHQGLSLWTLVPWVGLELLIGLAIGFCTGLALLGLQVAGQIIDQQLGFGLAGVYNPEQGSDDGPIGQFYFVMAIAIFLLLGGHRVVLGTLVNSFHTIPLGGLRADGRLVELVVALMGSAFELGLRVAGPLLCLVFLDTIALGFIARTVPQMNILSIGFPLRILMGTMLLVAVVSVQGEAFADTMRHMLESVARWIGP
jgi:flagellar biosynthetic protein FliR